MSKDDKAEYTEAVHKCEDHVLCPYCKHEQSDCHNGGDPGPWYNNEYIPEGELITECENCEKRFLVSVNWEVTFSSFTKVDEGNEQELV